MASSKFQDIRAAFKTLVDARLTTQSVTGVEVFKTQPMGNVTREDMIWLGRISVDQEPLTMGGTGRQVAEDLELAFSVRAPRSGSSQDEAAEGEARAEVLLSVIENALRADSTVGGTVMFAQVESFESIPDYDEAGFIGTIEGTITCQANL